MPVFVGYHGTKRSDARRIEQTNFVINQKIGWLGKGVYFFEENSALAESWALYKYGTSIEVLETVLEVPQDKIFDVSHPYSNDTRDFYEARDELIEIMVENGIDLDEEKSQLEGKVLDYICNTRGILLVRAYTYTYQENDRKDNRRLFSRFSNGIELCAKHNGIIKRKQILTSKTG
ncbi:hypothetical protein [Bacillus infantis]|uniref:hypothetical protein n=1 Tax=Bacillus infantis TaxID=324767 RepID=UPI003CEEA767